MDVPCYYCISLPHSLDRKVRLLTLASPCEINVRLLTPLFAKALLLPPELPAVDVPGKQRFVSSDDTTL
jgi:hypothetical protein